MAVGILADALPWKDMQGKSVSVCQNTSQQDWRNNLFSKADMPTLPLGTMTDNAPIDVISWNAGQGLVVVDGMEWWQQCMTLFMRHI